MFKQLTFALTLSFLATLHAHAETPAPTEPDWGQVVAARLAQASKRLNLSEEQQTKIRPILVEQVEKLRQLAEEHRGKSRVEMLSAIRELRALGEETRERLARHLTEEQQLEAKKMQEERRAQTQAALKNLDRNDPDALRKLLLPELKLPESEVDATASADE